MGKSSLPFGASQLARKRFLAAIAAMLLLFLATEPVHPEAQALPSTATASQPPKSASSSTPFLSDEENQFIGLSGLVLTIGALAIAIWQTKMAVSQNRDAQNQASRLEQIVEALSTKYMGPYPEYVAHIHPALERATREIRILCSVPIHGLFNNPEAWLKSKQAIESFLSPGEHDRIVRCVFANKEERNKLQRNQYKAFETDWPSWSTRPETHRKLASFVKRIDPKMVGVVDTFEGFISLLERASERELDTTFQGAFIVEIGYAPPMFLWIIDDKEAIFVLKSTYPEFRAEAFWTSDARLIASLAKIHESYMQLGASSTLAQRSPTQ